MCCKALPLRPCAWPLSFRGGGGGCGLRGGGALVAHAARIADGRQCAWADPPPPPPPASPASPQLISTAPLPPRVITAADAADATAAADEAAVAAAAADRVHQGRVGAPLAAAGAAATVGTGTGGGGCLG